MQDAYFEMDLTGNITFVNEATCRSLGYTREELIGRNYRMVASGEAEIKYAYEIYNKVFQTGKPNKGVAFKVVGKDGKVGYAETSISLLKDKNGDAIGFPKRSPGHHRKNIGGGKNKTERRTLPPFVRTHNGFCVADGYEFQDYIPEPFRVEK